jgi:hypothetical protein
MGNNHGGKRPGAGRNPSKIQLKSYPVRIEISDYEAMPGNKQEFIRQAIKSSLRQIYPYSVDNTKPDY